MATSNERAWWKVLINSGIKKFISKTSKKTGFNPENECFYETIKFATQYGSTWVPRCLWRNRFLAITVSSFTVFKVGSPVFLIHPLSTFHLHNENQWHKRVGQLNLAEVRCLVTHFSVTHLGSRRAWCRSCLGDSSNCRQGTSRIGHSGR